MEDVKKGKNSYEGIAQSLNNSLNAANGISALILAQRAPAGTTSAQLLNVVFSSCTAMLGEK